MDEASLLAWCVPAALLAIAGIFLTVGKTVSYARTWAGAYGLAAISFASMIVPATRWGIAKAVAEDGFVLSAIGLLVRGISMRAGKDPRTREATIAIALLLSCVAGVLIVFDSVAAEIAIVQIGCIGLFLFATYQLLDQLARLSDRVLFTLLILISVNLLCQCVVFTTNPAANLTLDRWQTTYFAFVFQLSGFTCAVAIAFASLLAIGQDAIEAQRLSAETDSLSGIYNRYGFQSRVEREIAAGPQEAVLVLIDLDHFKKINDRYGHSGGDMVIAALGSLLDTIAGRIGLAGRIGGEEFAFFTRQLPLDQATACCSRISDALRRIAWPEPIKEAVVTASYGVAAFEPGDDFAAIYRRADKSLYEAKAAGRDCVIISPPDTVQRVQPISDRSPAFALGAI